MSKSTKSREYEFVRSISADEIKKALGLAEAVDLVVDDVAPDGTTIGLMRLAVVRAIKIVDPPRRRRTK